MRKILRRLFDFLDVIDLAILVELFIVMCAVWTFVFLLFRSSFSVKAADIDIAAYSASNAAEDPDPAEVEEDSYDYSLQFHAVEDNPAYNYWRWEYTAELSSNCQLFLYRSNNSDYDVSGKRSYHVGYIDSDGICKSFYSYEQPVFCDSYLYIAYRKPYTEGDTPSRSDLYGLNEASAGTVCSFTVYSEDDYETDGYVFESLEAAQDFFDTGNKDGLIKQPVPDLDDAVLNIQLERPIIVRDSQSDVISFSNCSEELFIQIQGRWYTTDDFTLYKDGLIWKYKYDSLIKGSLTDWVGTKFLTSSVGNFNIHDLGSDAFDLLIEKYPISNRSYTGGTNALGNYLFGYNDALSTLKFLLSNSGSAFNGYEIYARYYYIADDGTVYKSKWTHFYNALAKSEGSSGSTWDDYDSADNDYQSSDGLTDDEKEDNENQDNPRNDPDASPKFDLNGEWNSILDGFVGSLQNIFDIFKSLFSLMGSVPAMISQVFGFFPSWLVSFISLSFALLILMRFLGR